MMPAKGDDHADDDGNGTGDALPDFYSRSRRARLRQGPGAPEERRPSGRHRPHAGPHDTGRASMSRRRGGRARDGEPAEQAAARAATPERRRPDPAVAGRPARMKKRSPAKRSP